MSAHVAPSITNDVSEKESTIFTEHAPVGIHNEFALHKETILEEVTAEALAREVIQVDEAKQAELERELQNSNQGGYVPVSPEEWAAHRGLNLKFDLFVVPFCTLIYLFVGLDRANIGNAATDNFTQDLGIPANAINTATSLFVATYVPLMPFTVYLGKRMGQRWFLGVMGLIWGVFTLCQAFIKTQGQLIAIRLVIGAAESGFFATAASYISRFYPRFNLAFRISLFFFAYAISGGLGGLIAYGAFTIQGSLYGWQYLFIIEGIISIVVAIATPLWLPAGPGSAWFLSKSERAYAEKRMVIDSAENFAGDTQVTKRDVVEAFKEWRFWAMLPSAMITTMGPTGFSTFLPLVIKGLGYSGAIANLMTLPPYVVGAIVCLCVCYSSDRTRERCIHMLSGLVVVIIGFTLTITLPEENVHARYGALIITLAGTFVFTPLNTSWLAGNTPEPGKRTMLLSLNGWGNVAQVFSSELFQSQYGPTYKYSMTVLLGLYVVAFFGYSGVAIALRVVNRYKAKKVAGMTPEELHQENLSDTRMGDKKWTFVYGT